MTPVKQLISVSCKVYFNTVSHNSSDSITCHKKELFYGTFMNAGYHTGAHSEKNSIH